MIEELRRSIRRDPWWPLYAAALIGYAVAEVLWRMP